jgi:biotin-(acetyl-CoA carboxylase) ligase
MTAPKAVQELAALRDAALEDLMSLSDEQLLQEAAEEGLDANQLALEMKAQLRNSAAAASRTRLSEAKARMRQPAEISIPRVRLPLEQIKQIIQDAFQNDTNLGLAFRDGKRQTESDWRSLYEDLIKVGAIRPNNNER